MTPLAPPLALAYLATLSSELVAAAIVGPGGETLSGDAGLGAQAAAALRGVPEGEVVRLPGAAPRGYAVRAAGHGAAAAVGARALGALVEHDLRAVLAELEAARA
jgi:hypothetical protein